MKTPSVILSLLTVLLCAAFVGCQTGSAIAVGQSKTPVPPEQVKLYVTPPKKFEVLGLVEATGKSGWTDQAKMDRAINELKKQAGKLGANGVLLASSGDKSGGMVGGVNNGMIYAGNVVHKSASGQAIFVTEE